MAETIGVIDYGMGNLHSLGKALERVASSQRVVISYEIDELKGCDKLVLPGVGGVRACMSELKRLELYEMVKGLDKQKQMREQIFTQELSSMKDRDRILQEKFQEAMKRADKDKDKPYRNPLDID